MAQKASRTYFIYAMILFCPWHCSTRHQSLKTTPSQDLTNHPKIKTLPPVSVVPPVTDTNSLPPEGNQKNQQNQLTITLTNASNNDATASNVFRYIGRVFNQGSNVLLAWPGTSMALDFQGGHLDILLSSRGSDQSMGVPKNGVKITVMIDGNEVADQIIEGLMRLSINATDNQKHQFLLLKQTEAADGTLVIYGLSGNSTAAILPSSLAVFSKNYLIEIYGDSISAGYGDLGNSIVCPQMAPGFSADPNYQAVSKTYGFLAASALQAQWSIIAWSGKGLYENGDGSLGATLRDLAFVDDPLYPCNCSSCNCDTCSCRQTQQKANVIVVNLGTNDFRVLSNEETTTISQTDKQNFVNSYISFITRLWGDSPQAHIILAVGPMLSDSYPRTEKQLSLMRSLLINDVIPTLQIAYSSQAGQLHYLEFPTNSGIFDSSGLSTMGCDYHPNWLYHQYMASGVLKNNFLYQDNLVHAIEAILLQ